MLKVLSQAILILIWALLSIPFAMGCMLALIADFLSGLVCSQNSRP